jgi:phosphate transport system permease protein
MNAWIADPVRRQAARRDPERRRKMNRRFVIFCVVTASSSLVVLVVLLLSILAQGLRFLSWTFLTSYPSPDVEEAGILSALTGTIWVCFFCALFTLPLGLATAIFLEEFKPKHRVARALHGFVQLNVANLAGVPSVVYGILGLTAFAGMFGLLGTEQNPAWEVGIYHYDQVETVYEKTVVTGTDEQGEPITHTFNLVALIPVERRDAPSSQLVEGTAALIQGRKVELHVIPPTAPLPDDDELRKRTVVANADVGRLSREAWYYLRLPFGRTVITGSLTLMLVVLPIVILASQEALRAVPDSLREAALSMGSTRWQMVRRVTLPAAVPGIMTGSILAMSRAIGEAAPILIIAGVIYKAMVPRTLMDGFTVMPLQIYNWVATRPQVEFHYLAASGIIVLLAVLLLFNALAIVIRQVYQKPLS